MTCSSNPIDTVPWSAFAPAVLLHCPTAPLNVIEHAVRETVIEWAERSMSLVRDIFIDAQENVRDYEVVAEDGYNIHTFNNVSYHDRNLRAAGFSMHHDLCYGYYAFRIPSALLLGETPDCDEARAIYVSAVVKPSQVSCSVDRWVFERHAEAISTGAISRMALIANQDWTSVQTAGIMLRRWEAFLGRIKSEVSKNYSTAPSFMRARRFI
jgi:hypothetical protein